MGMSKQKLSERTVRHIREACEMGATNKEIARMFGVADSTVSLIKRGVKSYATQTPAAETDKTAPERDALSGPDR